MVGQHDASRPHAHRFCDAGYMSDEDAGGGGADAAHIVVFGEPVSVVVQRFGAPGLFGHDRIGMGRTLQPGP